MSAFAGWPGGLLNEKELVPIGASSLYAGDLFPLNAQGHDEEVQ